MAFSITGDSPEAVAYGLMMSLLQAEGKANKDSLFSDAKFSENELLSLYDRCLAVVKQTKPLGVSQSQT